jgi:hypothetical protein
MSEFMPDQAQAPAASATEVEAQVNGDVLQADVEQSARYRRVQQFLAKREAERPARLERLFELMVEDNRNAMQRAMSK